MSSAKKILLNTLHWELLIAFIFVSYVYPKCQQPMFEIVVNYYSSSRCGENGIGLHMWHGGLRKDDISQQHKHIGYTMRYKDDRWFE